VKLAGKLVQWRAPSDSSAAAWLADLAGWEDTV
jgi:hypothetical protein